MKRKRVEEAPMRLVKRALADHDDEVGTEPEWSIHECGRRTEKENGVAFLKMVKDTLKDEVVRYDDFIRSMQTFKRGLINTREVIRRVKILFKNHPGLLIGFNIFLRPTDRIKVPTEDEVDVEKLKIALRFVNKVKVRFATEGGHVYRRFLEILRAFKFGMSVKEVHENVISLFRGNEDLLVEFRDFLPTRSLRNWVSLVASVVKKSRVVPLPVFSDGTASSHQEPEQTQDQVPVEPPQKKHCKAAGAQEQEKEPEPTLDRGASGRAGAVSIRCTKLHEESSLREPILSNGLTSGGQVRCLRRRQRAKLAAPETAGIIVRRRRRRAKEPGALEAAQLGFFETVSKTLQSGIVYREFMQCMNIFRHKIISASQLQVLVNNVLQEHPELQKAFHDCFPSSRKDLYQILDRWQSCTPSYRLHENAFSEPASTSSESTSQAEDGRSTGPLSTKGVLNDTWVTLTTGGNAFTSQESNRYEEILFRAEDDQYEIDMLMETTRSTAGKVAECIEMLKDPPLPQFELENHLTSLHLRSLERIYGPIWPQFIAQIRESPTSALPVILERLEQRLAHWKSYREEMNTVWAEVRLANHSKSLVYESDVEEIE